MQNADCTRRSGVPECTLLSNRYACCLGVYYGITDMDPSGYVDLGHELSEHAALGELQQQCKW